MQRFCLVACANGSCCNSDIFSLAQALLHQEMTELRQRRADLKRQAREAAKEEKALAKKRQRLMQAES